MSHWITVEECVDRLLKLSQQGFSEAEVDAFMRSTRLEPKSMAKFEHWKDNFYARSLIYKDEQFELLLLCWDIGQASPVHGHEGEKCWARVESGRLRFTNFVETAPRVDDHVRLESTGFTDGEAGALDGPAGIHRVANPAEFQARAVSLHLYSKPFAECEMYDLERHTVKRCSLKYDAICQYTAGSFSHFGISKPMDALTDYQRRL